MNRSQTGGYVLKFISGKYQGGEFPLDPDSEIEIGRGGELDMVLVEDMVSRRHARITTYGGELYIEDFGSTNGTFVNGEKIEERARITEGDRILIGTNIIKLVHRDNVEAGGDPEMAPSAGAGINPDTHAEDDTAQVNHQPRSQRPQTGTPPPQTGTPPPQPDNVPQSQAAGPTQPPRQQGGGHQTQAAPAVNQTMGAGGSMGGISGLIEEVPLPDLLQLFSTSRKSGVLVLVRDDEVGKVFLREGRVYFATINDDHELDPYKAFYRMIAWEEGTFNLEPPTDESFENEIDESVESLMMEGMRILDELKNLGPDTPDMEERLAVPSPLQAPLRELDPDQLDTFQRALNHDTVGDVLNKTEEDDVQTMERLVDLIDNNYLVTTGS